MPVARPILILATANRGKAEEVRAMLPSLVIETLADHPDIVMPPEDEDTFAGNARIKAEHVAKVTGRPALADDSGLLVDALGGAPGVRSARYAPGSDLDRIEKLLDALLGVAASDRTARFVSAMAFAVTGEETVIVEGRCQGRIAAAPRGDGGFGYDPVFVVDAHERADGAGSGEKTMAELTLEEKNRVSHRARALAAIRPLLERHLLSRSAPPD